MEIPVDITLDKYARGAQGAIRFIAALLVLVGAQLTCAQQTTDSSQLTVSPSALTFAVPEGGPAPSSQTITVSGPNGTSITVVPSLGFTSFLTASVGGAAAQSNDTATTPATITVGVIWPPPVGLLAYDGSIEIVGCPQTCQTIDVPVSLVLLPAISGVTNAASYSANSLSPGAVATIFGSNLVNESNSSSFSNLPLPKMLGGASVTVNGAAVPLFYASPTQINLQIPYETQVGTASVIVKAYSSSESFSVPIAAASPGIFTFGTNRAVAQNPDGSLNDSNNGVAAGAYIVAYLTGIGPLDNPVPDGAAAPDSPLSEATSPFSATIGGQNAPVLFLGLTPGFVGLAQANIKVPQLSSGSYPLVITINGVPSNAPSVTIR